MAASFDQIKAVFLNAVKNVPPNDWDDYLRQACAPDDAMLGQVKELLAAHASGGVVTPPLIADAISSTSSDLVGEMVGPYRLLERLGEGGMGAVFVAEQIEPVCRRVALKIIKPGMSSPQTSARFEMERQALAMMEHPNIARILDAGMFEDRPYFVMELVRGQPITQYCDQSRLSPRHRLELFVSVCKAVQHAHQKGIIHRDLTPNNVLVEVHDGKPVVKVIDFGIAKAVGEPISAGIVRTAFTQVLGTPLYMSPEQAGQGAADIDTRSDVYSLGVLLYELLTGKPPFSRQTLERLGLDELRRMICEVDPPSPSKRMSALDAAEAAELSSRCALSHRSLCQFLRGELDWIVMKALEKDRNRRYESAGALGADVGCYLRSEPVLACPPSMRYRLRKLAARNRGLLTGALLVAAALIMGTGVATWQAIEANRARRLADIHLASEQAAHRAAEIERDRARSAAELNRRLLYAGDMRLAGQSWRRDDAARMHNMLARHVPAPGESDLRGFEWYFLHKQGEIQHRELLALDSALYFVCFSPDGKTLAAAGADGVIRLLDGRTFELRGTIASRQVEVNGLAFSPGSTILASAGDDGTVALWDMPQGTERLRFRAHQSLAYQVAFADEGKLLITCGRDPVIRLWDAKTGKSAGTLAHHAHPIEAISVSVQGHLAAGCRDGDFTVWDIGRRALLKTVRDNDVVSCVAFSPSGEVLASGQFNGKLTLVHSTDWSSLGRQTMPDAIQTVALPRAGAHRVNWIAVGDRSGNVHLLPADHHYQGSGLAPKMENSKSRQWAAHHGRVYSMTFSPDASQLITAGEDGRLVAWNLDLPSAYRALPDSGRRFAFLDDGRLVAASPGLPIYDDRLSEPDRFFAANDDPWQDVQFASGSGHVFGLDAEGTVHQWTKEGESLGVAWRTEPDQIAGRFGVSRDCGTLAIEVGAPYGARQVELLRAGVVSHIPCNDLVGLVLSLDGRFLMLPHENDLRVLDSESGAVVRILDGHRAAIRAMALSPDGNLLASVSADRTLRIWDWRTGREIWSEVAHERSAACLAFSPDGQTIATSGDDGMIRFWRWTTRRLMLELPVELWRRTDESMAIDSVAQLAFSPDGMRLAAVIEDDAIAVFDATPSDSSPSASPLNK